MTIFLLNSVAGMRIERRREPSTHAHETREGERQKEREEEKKIIL